MDFETEWLQDWLRIYNGSNDNGKRLGAFSGSSTPSDIWFVGNVMYLEFTSDWTNNKKGFRILVRTFGE